MSENYICKKCQKSIKDIAEAMINGCECGSRVFKQLRGDSDPEIDQINKVKLEIKENEATEEELDENVSILVQEKGVYSVNLKSLFNRESNVDPIIIQDTEGKMNVLLNPDA